MARETKNNQFWLTKLGMVLRYPQTPVLLATWYCNARHSVTGGRPRRGTLWPKEGQGQAQRQKSSRPHIVCIFKGQPPPPPRPTTLPRRDKSNNKKNKNKDNDNDCPTEKETSVFQHNVIQKAWLAHPLWRHTHKG